MSTAGSGATERGKPDASDCTQITNARNASYTLREADAGFRIRSQVSGDER